MNHACSLRISFKSNFGNVDMVRAAVRGICTDFFQLAVNAASIMDFCLMVTELMNNAVEHTNTQVIDIEILLSNHEAVFRLISEGAGFDPTLTVEMPSLKQDEELPDGGYGLAIIQELADSMEYERRGSSNMVTLRKVFPEKPEKEQ